MKKGLKCILLYPVSILYTGMVEIRNILFDLEFFKSKKLPVPVLSVGNINMGGTGKTPFVIALCQKLKQRFSHIVVISRGYGRKSKGAFLVSLKGEIKLSVEEAGEEPYFIAHKCPHISVVVSEKRFLGWKKIEKETPSIIILDDGFQHRWIYRDIDIVLQNGNFPVEKDAVFPLGRLREPIYRIKRADFVCITKKKIPLTNKQGYFDTTMSKYHISKKIDLDKEYVLVSGIANPKEFESTAKFLGIKIKRHYIFGDHFFYGEEFFHKLKEEIIITTEKDYDKLVRLNVSTTFVTVLQEYKLPKEFVLNIFEKLDSLSSK